MPATHPNHRDLPSAICIVCQVRCCHQSSSQFGSDRNPKIVLDSFLLKLSPTKRSRTLKVWSWLVLWEMMEDLHGDTTLSKGCMLPGIRLASGARDFIAPVAWHRLPIQIATAVGSGEFLKSSRVSFLCQTCNGEIFGINKPFLKNEIGHL